LWLFGAVGTKNPVGLVATVFPEFIARDERERAHGGRQGGKRRVGAARRRSRGHGPARLDGARARATVADKVMESGKTAEPGNGHPRVPTARQAKRAGPKLDAGPEASAEQREGMIEARRGRDAAGGSMRQHESATGHLPGGRGRHMTAMKSPWTTACPGIGTMAGPWTYEHYKTESCLPRPRHGDNGHCAARKTHAASHTSWSAKCAGASQGTTRPKRCRRPTCSAPCRKHPGGAGSPGECSGRTEKKGA